MSEKKYHCPVEGCSFSEQKGKHFKRKMSIDQHYLNCHSERKYKCFNCDKSYAIDWQLKYHLKTCGLIWKCLTCDKFYKERLSLITHCTRHSHVLPEEARRRKTKTKKEDKQSANNNNNNSSSSSSSNNSKDNSMQVMIFPVMMPTTQANSHQTPTTPRQQQTANTSTSSSSSTASSRHHSHHTSHHNHHHIQPPKQIQQPTSNRVHHHHPQIPKTTFQSPIASPTVDHHQFNQRLNLADLYRTFQMDTPQMMDPNTGYIKDTTAQSEVDHLKHGLHHFAPPRAHIW